MTFQTCVIECANRPDFLKEFNRLTGRRLGDQLARSPMAQAVDKATGYDEVLKAQQNSDARAFVEFCHDYVWLPLIEKQASPALH